MTLRIVSLLTSGQSAAMSEIVKGVDLASTASLTCVALVAVAVCLTASSLAAKLFVSREHDTPEVVEPRERVVLTTVPTL